MSPSLHTPGCGSQGQLKYQYVHNKLERDKSFWTQTATYPILKCLGQNVCEVFSAVWLWIARSTAYVSWGFSKFFRLRYPIWVQALAPVEKRRQEKQKRRFLAGHSHSQLFCVYQSLWKELVDWLRCKANPFSSGVGYSLMTISCFDWKSNFENSFSLDT